jgi:hypothetical protein
VLDRLKTALESLDRGVWPVVSFLLAIAARLLPWGIPNDALITAYSAVWIFAGLAATSVALLALQYAITTFRGQQLASRLPTALISDLFLPPEHWATLWRVVAIFATSLWTLGPITNNTLPPSALTVSVIDTLLVLITMISIARNSRRVFGSDYSNTVASLVVHRLTDDYLGDRPIGKGQFPPPLPCGGRRNRPAGSVRSC